MVTRIITTLDTQRGFKRSKPDETFIPNLQTPLLIEHSFHVPLHKRRKIQTLTVEQLETVAKIRELIPSLIEWQKNAERLRMQASQLELPEQDRYESASEGANAFIREISKDQSFDEKFFFACYDIHHLLRGLIFLSPPWLAGPRYKGQPHLVVELLLVDPEHIASPLVRAAEQIKGIGTALMSKAEEIASQEGANGIILSSDSSAIGFYQRLGYQEDGTFMKKDISVRE